MKPGLTVANASRSTPIWPRPRCTMVIGGVEQRPCGKRGEGDIGRRARRLAFQLPGVAVGGEALHGEEVRHAALVHRSVALRGPDNNVRALRGDELADGCEKRLQRLVQVVDALTNDGQKREPARRAAVRRDGSCGRGVRRQVDVLGRSPGGFERNAWAVGHCRGERVGGVGVGAAATGGENRRRGEEKSLRRTHGVPLRFKVSPPAPRGKRAPRSSAFWTATAFNPTGRAWLRANCSPRSSAEASPATPGERARKTHPLPPPNPPGRPGRVGRAAPLRGTSS